MLLPSTINQVVEISWIATLSVGRCRRRVFLWQTGPWARISRTPFNSPQ
jgi:hypothetical protein